MEEAGGKAPHREMMLQRHQKMMSFAGKLGEKEPVTRALASEPEKQDR